MSLSTRIHQRDPIADDRYFESKFHNFGIAWAFFETATEKPTPSASQFSDRYSLNIEKANQIFKMHLGMQIWRCEISSGQTLTNFLSNDLSNAPSIIKEFQAKIRAIYAGGRIFQGCFASQNDRIYGVYSVFLQNGLDKGIDKVLLYMTGELNPSRKNLLETYFQVESFSFTPPDTEAKGR